MGVDRPTFSESWYRVAELCPRLRSTVQITRQHFRGQTWHVVQDPSSNQYFRLNEPGYRFVGLLDGRRTVSEVWKICNEQLGDSAPTQGEAIQLLGQLYTSNLLQADLPPDAEGLFVRYRKRRTREIQGYLMNILFIRLPFLDPDRFLDAWAPIFGRLFTWYGLILWLAMVSVGGYVAVTHWGMLTDQAETVFSQQHLANNLPLMYFSFVLIKVFHEFGHAFSCKRFGQVTGTGGEVHAMGVMFLVFTPMPYVDASSAWAFRKKSHRAVVGAAGMLVEMAVASVAAVIWANTSSQSDLHAVTYNMMFIASVSTVLFNGNPLLRYDAYYILSDLLEIPNLAQRAKNYIYYLVRRYAWGVRNPQNPAHTRGEKAWFLAYGTTSTVYRFYICAMILLFIADKLFMVGFLLAIAASVAWICVPLVKFLKYLATNGELMRVRWRAVLTTLAVVGAAVGGLGFLQAPDRFRAEGVVEPVRLALVHAQVDGFLESFLPSGQQVRPGDGQTLLRLSNPELAAKRAQLLAEKDRLLAQDRKASSDGNFAARQFVAMQLASVDKQLRRVEELVSYLNVRAPVEGTWVAPTLDQHEGSYLHRGDAAGLVASLDQIMIRAMAGQDVELGETGQHVEIRVLGRPDPVIAGTIRQILPAGQSQLPSAALGYQVGGSIATAADDRQGTKAAEHFFEVQIDPAGTECLWSGQRVEVRFDRPPKPLIAQWWRSLLQLVQRRFQV